MTEVIDNEVDLTTPADESEVVSEVDTPTEAEKPEVEATDLTAFWAAVDAINPEAPDYDAVASEYEKLSRKGKMQATHGIKARTFAALDADEYPKAKALANAGKALGSAATSGESTVDPSEELVNRMAGIFISYETLAAANVNLGERVTQAIEKARADAESVPALLAKRLIETKMGRKPRETGGTRHNIGKHIAQAFEGKADGTFMSVNDLTSAKTEEYGDDAPAYNSINTHLKSGKFEQEGLTVTEVDGKLGVLKGSVEA